MIAFLSGTVKERTDEAIFLEVNGIGFRVLMAASTLEKIRIGEAVLIHTYLAHKEDAMLLYGFLSQADKALFIKLINVSGVGPKTALAVLSLFSADEFCRAILSEDVKFLAKVPGIGQKTAQRLILELKTTLVKEAQQFNLVPDATKGPIPAADDAVAALEALGYETIVALKAVKEVRAVNPGLDLQAVIKRALNLLIKE